MYVVQSCCMLLLNDSMVLTIHPNVCVPPFSCRSPVSSSYAVVCVVGKRDRRFTLFCANNVEEKCGVEIHLLCTQRNKTTARKH